MYWATHSMLTKENNTELIFESWEQKPKQLHYKHSLSPEISHKISTHLLWMNEATMNTLTDYLFIIKLINY